MKSVWLLSRGNGFAGQYYTQSREEETGEKPQLVTPPVPVPSARLSRHSLSPPLTQPRNRLKRLTAISMPQKSPI
ncbi:MAG: hypothetical protein RBR35_12225 [Salinivirgaceae bacterium]|nr:hypothetical protein [Salinivirgaceae bacterium]